MNDTYSQPEDGWVCFHCGERFTTFGAARDHFGERPEAKLACQIKVGNERGLIMELRKAEYEIERRHSALTELTNWLEQRVMDIIPDVDKPATKARIELGYAALDGGHREVQ